MSGLPSLTAIVLCRNEKEFIGRCLSSVVANDYPSEQLEILVVDGMSDDGTREIVAEFESRYSFVRLIDNEERLTPFAMNTGIKNASGELIMVMSGHATYEKDYIRKCAEASERYGAESVVGSWKVVPRERNAVARAIARVMSDSFGVGNATYRTGASEDPVWVDTGAYGCYRRSVFDAIGLFNERLTRGQDMELNVRLRKAGGRILLVPDAIVNYYARTDLKTFCVHNFRNGVWAIRPFLFTDVLPVSWRHLVPLVFVATLVGSALLALVSPVGFWLLAGVAGTYALANLGASLRAAIADGSVAFLFLGPVAFACLHLPYGLGSLWGLITALGTREFWQKLTSFGWST